MAGAHLPVKGETEESEESIAISAVLIPCKQNGSGREASSPL